MESIVQVGEHTLAIHSQSDRLLNWIHTYFQIGNKTVDLTVEISENYGISFAGYQVQITTDADCICYQRADYRLELASDYRSAKLQVYDELALKHGLTNLYSAFIIHIEWGLLIHSSCVDHEQKAYLFAGCSGAGKSTVARLSAPRPLLSDEATLVKIAGGKIRVFDSPFRSECTTVYLPQSCELSKIFLLNQSTDIKLALIKKSNAMLVLLDKIFFWRHDPLETAKLLSMCRQLAERVPAYDLYFQKNNAFWELIS